MNAKEFRDSGILQEVNRQFFHPLGLALQLTMYGDERDEKPVTLQIRDERDKDNLGLVFKSLNEPDDHARWDRFNEEMNKRQVPRLREFGFWVQPMGDTRD